MTGIHSKKYYDDEEYAYEEEICIKNRLKQHITGIHRTKKYTYVVGETVS